MSETEKARRQIHAHEHIQKKLKTACSPQRMLHKPIEQTVACQFLTFDCDYLIPLVVPTHSHTACDVGVWEQERIFSSGCLYVHTYYIPTCKKKDTTTEIAWEISSIDFRKRKTHHRPTRHEWWMREMRWSSSAGSTVAVRCRRRRSSGPSTFFK